MLHHLEQVKSLYRLPNAYNTELFQRLGGLCVAFFFVLSGFLITYLLLEEDERLGSIDIGKFYTRRICRIWPLYFVLVFLGFAVLPRLSLYRAPGQYSGWARSFLPALSLYLIFSPHVATALGYQVPYAGVLWSVGVEEWFYAVWPWLIRFRRNALVPFAMLVLVIVVLRNSLSLGVLRNLLGMLSLDCMLIGCAAAMLLRRAERGGQHCANTRALIFQKKVQVVVYLLIALGMVRGWRYGIQHPAYSVLFGVVILNVAANPGTIVTFENRTFRWLGDLSYGIYCYNWIAIVTVAALVTSYGSRLPGLLSASLIEPLSIALTIAIAGLSYEFIERRFLLLKSRDYTRVPTPGPSRIVVLRGRPDEPTAEAQVSTL